MPRVPTPAPQEAGKDLILALAEEDEQANAKAKRIAALAATVVLLATIGLIGWRVMRSRASAGVPTADATQATNASAEGAPGALPPAAGTTITVPVDPTRIPPPASPPLMVAKASAAKSASKPEP
jgi:hypothetical protein